jgi:hypothetical protein
MNLDGYGADVRLRYKNIYASVRAHYGKMARVNQFFEIWVYDGNGMPDAKSHDWVYICRFVDLKVYRRQGGEFFWLLHEEREILSKWNWTHFLIAPDPFLEHCRNGIVKAELFGDITHQLSLFD